MSENASGQACSIQPEAAEHKPGEVESISFGVLLTAKTEENIMMVSSPFELHLVHLDLKGAPPRVSYLAEIFPLLHVLGANGILLEYEDMYPYDGELKPLRANDAYSPSEVKEILKLAKSHDLEVIPLIQTFGHMEFVLKHKEFCHLRKASNGTTCDLRWFHIGCDEVMFGNMGLNLIRKAQPFSSDHSRLAHFYVSFISFGVLLTAKTEENIMMVSSPFELHLVHLDLKGLHPESHTWQRKENIFPLLHVLGANGILLEYEDMYPYDGELKPLRANDAYSPSEVKEILKLAKSHDLEVIPLIQTFGHMEFVLKHKEFCHLREVAMFPNTVNPHKEDSLKLVIAMIEQVMALHDDLRWFHIGCDEVYYLGEGEESKEWLQQEENTIEKLCLAHMKAVASHIVSTHPTVKPIVWDDMLRRMSKETLRDSGLAQLIELMIWDYSPDLDVESKASLIEKYQKCNFSKFWFASAFKGATGVNQCLTLIGHHLKNHKQWLKVAESCPAGIIRGITLTGWQRCLDTLEKHIQTCYAFCQLKRCFLKFLQSEMLLLYCLTGPAFSSLGGYSEKVREDVEKLLGLSHLEIDSFMSDITGTFPGNEILSLVSQIAFHLKSSVDELLENNRYVTGWFSPYHRKRKKIHPIMIHHFQPDAIRLLTKWTVLTEELQTAMKKIFYTTAVEEWIEENVQPSLQRLQGTVDDLNCAVQELS
ncbi:putative Hexosaminidase D-like protein [Naja naja]|nr:putative Hexosaminidase D-like protein [Naja naja]